MGREPPDQADGAGGSALAADADVVGVGEAAAPTVATDFDRR